MSPTDFPGSNLRLVKPPNMTDEECFELPAYKGEVNGVPIFVTAWMPSYEDRKAIEEGRPIYLRTLGEGFAPCVLFTLDEEGNSNEE